MGTGLTVTVDTVDITAYVNCTSIEIEEVGTERVATCSFEVRDHTGTVEIHAKDSVDIRPTGGGASAILFAGEVSDVNTERRGIATVFRVQCHCNNVLLDERVVEYESYVAAQADSTIIADLFTTYRGDIGTGTYVDTIDSSMDAIRFEQMTLREVMDAICQRTGGRYYVDYAKELHYFEAESGLTASFSLSTSPNMSTSYPFRDWKTSEDGTQLVTHLFIVGEDITGWWPNGAGGPDWSSDERHGVSYARGATTQAELEAHGAAVLASYNTARITYECTIEQPGLRAGQYVAVVHAGLSIDDSFYIRSMHVRVLSTDGDQREYQLELNDESPDPVRQSHQTYQNISVISSVEMPVGHRGWTHDLVFSATDNDTVAWAAGTITLADGRTQYSIDAGSLNLSDVTYIYLDVDTSVTVLQNTTDNAAAIGEQKILVCVAEDIADATKFAQFAVFGTRGLGGTFLGANNIATNSLTANEIAANTITAAEIAAGTITATEIAALTITGGKIAAGTLTADKLIIGESPFTLAEGLLLLTSPFSLERGATSYILGTRDDKATIANAIHFEPGRWAGSQGVVMEAGTTNLITDPSIEVGATAWTGYRATETVSRSTSAFKFNSGSLYCLTTTSTSTEGVISSSPITITASTAYTVSVWLRTSFALTLGIAWYTAADAFISANTVSCSAASYRWRRHNVTGTAPGTAAQCRIYVIETTGSASAASWFMDGFQLEALGMPTTTCIGDMAHCAWSGTAHASTSTRSATTLQISVSGNIIGAVGSVAMWVRIPDDWHSSAGFLWCAGDANAEFDAYVNSAGAIVYRINGSTRCNSADGAVTVATWHHIVFTWSSAADVSNLYLDGALIDTGIVDGTPTLGTYLGIGYSPILGAGYNLNGVIGEFAVTGDVMTATEVADLCQLQRPLIDLGGTRAPGILLINTEGDRMEITAQEVACYSGNSKCVELDKDGIACIVDTSASDVRSYQFRDSSGTLIGRLSGYSSGGQYMLVEVPSTASTDSAIGITATAPADQLAQVSISADRPTETTNATILCNINQSTNAAYVWTIIDSTVHLVVDSAGVQVQTQIFGNTDLVFETGALGTYSFRPDYGSGSGYLGNGTYYWAEVNYKTLTDRGCLADFGQDLEMKDGARLSPLSALRQVGTSDKASVHGAPMLDYATFPAVCYRPGLTGIADKDIYDHAGNLRWKKGEPCGDEGVEISSLLSILLAAVREHADVTDEARAAIAALEARVAKMEGTHNEARP